MLKPVLAILVFALAACTTMPAPRAPQQAQSACTPDTESSYACQVERYNAIGSQ